MRGPGAVWRGLPSCRTLVTLLCCLLALAPQAAAWAAHVITRIDVRPGPGETVITLFSAERQPLDVNSFLLEDPPRLVFDFAGAQLDPSIPAQVPVVAPALRQIRLGQFSPDPPIARLVVDLSDGLPPPICEVSPGAEPGQTLIVLRARGAAVLEAPALEIADDAAVVRLRGAGQLHRSVASLSGPPRVYADLSNAVIEQTYRQDVPDGAVRQIRMGQQPAGPDCPVARIVVELREDQPHIILTDGPDLLIAVGPQPWALPVPAYQPDGRLKGRRIVVDPGHGGHDIGAPAKFGSPSQEPFEKDIVLDIGRRLASLLQAEGAEVSMTRNADIFLGLKERAALANDLKAHALVSIHCDSCARPNALHGTSVYYDHAHSRRFAQLVQRELVAALGTADKGVRNANFAVIRRTQGPGVLVEVAYINHDTDRAKLVHPNAQERAARAILQGLIRFLSDTPDRADSRR